MIIKIGNNEKVMGQYKNSWLSNIFITLAFLAMLAAAVVLFISIGMSR